jgi:hypothetical protein
LHPVDRTKTLIQAALPRHLDFIRADVEDYTSNGTRYSAPTSCTGEAGPGRRRRCGEDARSPICASAPASRTRQRMRSPATFGCLDVALRVVLPAHAHPRNCERRISSLRADERGLAQWSIVGQPILGRFSAHHPAGAADGLPSLCTQRQILRARPAPRPTVEGCLPVECGKSRHHVGAYQAIRLAPSCPACLTLSGPCFRRSDAPISIAR